MEILVSSEKYLINFSVFDWFYLKGEASLGIREQVGECSYNIKIIYSRDGREELGVMMEGGETVIMRGEMMGMRGDYQLKWITEDTFESEKDKLDSMEEPPGPYKLQPEVRGKLVWLTGCPGMGKSTSAQILARDNGYVYYEADGFIGGRNPFVDLTSSNPSMQQAKQNKLKG